VSSRRSLPTVPLLVLICEMTVSAEAMVRFRL